MGEVTPEGLAHLKDHEGFRSKPYLDTVGKTSIGYGRNLSDVGISQREADFLLTDDIEKATAQCRSAFDWFDALDSVRQDAVVNLVFNMGLEGLKTFHLFLAAMANKDWPQAAFQLWNSAWSRQVQKSRVDEITAAIEYGVWD